MKCDVLLLLDALNECFGVDRELLFGGRRHSFNGRSMVEGRLVRHLWPRRYDSVWPAILCMGKLEGITLAHEISFQQKIYATSKTFQLSFRSRVIVIA